MDALTALHHRVSCALLTEPGPSQAQLETMLKAAARAPDHANLRPWRFLLVEGHARQQMGELMAKAVLADKPETEPAALDKVRRKPLRAPTIVIAVAQMKEHPKVPEIEQIISVGAAANNLIIAAFALGVGAYWRTGSAAYHPVVKEGLGLSDNEIIIGFIYLGTPQVKRKPAPEVCIQDIIEPWGENDIAS
ncbi:MAG: nitroreductase family protein [Pseudomonadales bacterium]|nr:nitroreductase family protein [Pseudomonadales bacterium]